MPTDMTRQEIKNMSPTESTDGKDKDKPKKRVVSYDVIGNGVAAPTHLWKVIVAVRPKPEFVKERLSKEKAKEKEYSEYIEQQLTEMGPVGLGAFVMPNAPERHYRTLTDFQVPLDAVERLSGLDLSGLVLFCRDSVDKG